MFFLRKSNNGSGGSSGSGYGAGFTGLALLIIGLVVLWAITIEPLEDDLHHRATQGSGQRVQGAIWYNTTSNEFELVSTATSRNIDAISTSFTDGLVITLDSSDSVTGSLQFAGVSADKTYTELQLAFGFNVTNSELQELSVFDGAGYAARIYYDDATDDAWEVQEFGVFDHTVSIDDTEFAGEGIITVTHDEIVGENGASIAFDYSELGATYTAGVTAATSTTTSFIVLNSDTGAAVTTPAEAMSFWIIRPGMVKFTQTSWESVGTTGSSVTTTHSADANLWVNLEYAD